MKGKPKPALKFLVIFLILGGLFGAYLKFGHLIAPEGTTTLSIDSETKKLMKNKKVKHINVGVVTWGGYIGGQYYNKGFRPNVESNFYKDCGILVDFKVLDDFSPSRDAWKKGDIDLLWVTVDAFPTEVEALAEFKPKLVFQADWSRGGDAIVVKHGINTVKDLAGKKIAVAFGTPSHSLLLKTLEASGMSYNSVNVVEVPSAIDAASTFKSGSVDAAVVWSPDDEDCLKNVVGSKIITNTKQATSIIADGFFAKEDWIQENRDPLECFVKGFLKGSGEINSNPKAREEAVQILAKGFNIDEAWADKMISNVRLTTYGDNLNFFGITTSYKGVTGEALYNNMGALYSNIGLVKRLPPWRSVSDSSILLDISLSGPENDAEGSFTFTPVTKEVATTQAFSEKSLSITFPTGSYVLDDNAKVIIDMGFVDTAKTFAGSRIRVEGNTDSVGDLSSNVRLSELRANAVASYLINKYGFDRNRFIIIGNGPNSPVADNSTNEGRAKNRRTDFKLVEN